MNQAHVAELKTTLVGAPLPARRPELLEYAVHQHAEPALLDALGALCEGKEYGSLDEVVEDLLHVQPSGDGAVPPRPKEESGPPPGGDAYGK